MRTINARTGRESGIHPTTRGTGPFRSHNLTESVEGRLLTVEPKTRTAAYLDPMFVTNKDDPDHDCFLVHLHKPGSIGPLVHFGSDRYKARKDLCSCGSAF